MKGILIFAALVLSGMISSGQTVIHQSLKNKLDTILIMDQGIREYIVGNPTETRKDTISKLLKIPRDSLDRNGWGIMNSIDKMNLAKVEKIIAHYGYPGKSLVGEPTNTAVFFVIQHSDKIPFYLPLIKKAAETKELPFRYYAMMLDRKLAGEGKEQVYGTQVFSQQITDPGTGEKKMFDYVVPVRDPKNVNKRRKDAGFDSTIEENALRLGVTYKPYTYDEIYKITGQKK
ncbi:hypothetical protein A8C56_14510 [Niabella ginsenosidivorans]|uniref:Uncharacterized protein n=1 Tax=Niabella ginsenosidivorans TaxID=1176587 RepID=A0A1A9IBL1_9BACT|nr:DUF6624 domain-containing protein [Niabella ginsenosidivorans]ANH83954.1 hypothetical protein A8C56_14510 [Niabella ginsenosidivorans]